MIAIILIFLLLQCYSSLSGFKDAILYAGKGADSFKWNEHLIFVAERTVVFLLIIPAMFITWWDMAAIGLCHVMSLSFFHNGFYYLGRHNIDAGYYDFNSNSLTSTAKIELSWYVRLSLFIISLIILTGYLSIAK